VVEPRRDRRAAGQAQQALDGQGDTARAEARVDVAVDQRVPRRSLTAVLQLARDLHDHLVRGRRAPPALPDREVDPDRRRTGRGREAHHVEQRIGLPLVRAAVGIDDAALRFGLVRP
jgi:hypothetical protein